MGDRASPCSELLRFGFPGLGPRRLWAAAPRAIVLLSWFLSRILAAGWRAVLLFRAAFYLFLCFHRYSRRNLEVYESGCVLKRAS